MRRRILRQLPEVSIAPILFYFVLVHVCHLFHGCRYLQILHVLLRLTDLRALQLVKYIYIVYLHLFTVLDSLFLLLIRF